METTATTTKKVISDKSERAQRIMNNANAKKSLAQEVRQEIVRQNKYNDKKAETKVPETKVPDQKAIESATKRVEELTAQLIEARKALRSLTGKPAKTDKGPGVISSILDILKKHPKGISKEDILTKLTEMFPDRAPEGMNKTISVQLPGRMSKERKVKIVKSDDGKFSIK